MTLNFPDSPSTGDIYDDSTSGFRYEWNGTVWISTDPQRAANIKELDDISGGFNGSTTQFNLTVASSAVEPVSDAQILISVGGVMQNPTNDYTVSGSTITFTTAPSAGLTFFGVFLGQALSLNTIQDGTVEFASFKTGTAGVGIQSAGSQIGVGITNLNFIGTGNTFVAIGNTVNVSVNVGGIDTTGTSYFNNITASGNLNVTGDLTYDEVTAVNQKISGVTTTTGLDVLGITSTKDLNVIGVSTFTGIIDGNGGANISGGAGLVASSAKVSDLTSGRVTYAGSSGELQDNAGLTFDGTTLAATRLAAPVAFTTSLTAANVDVTGITTIRDDLTLKGASANITFDKSTDDLIFADGAKAVFGTGSDLSVYHNGTNSIISNDTGDLILGAGNGSSVKLQPEGGEDGLTVNQNGSVEAYYDNTKRLETTSVGVNVVGNVDCDSLNNAGITTLTGAATLNGNTTFGADVTFGGASSATALVWDKSVDDLIFADGAKAVFGTGGDLEIFHNGSHSNITNAGTGRLYLNASQINLHNQAATENMLKAVENDAVTLYFDNSAKINTTSVGVNVTGNVDCDTLNVAGIGTFGGAITVAGDVSAEALTATNTNAINLGDDKKILLGTGSDLQIYHSGDDSFIKDSGTGGLRIDSNQFLLRNAAGDENMLLATENGSIALYFDNTKRVETTSVGMNVVGNVDCDSINNAGISTFAGDATFGGGAGAVTINGASDIRLSNGSWTGDHEAKIQHHDNKLYICGGTSGIKFREGNTDRWNIDGSGHFIPDTDSNYNIGENAKRVANVYADTYYGDGSNMTGVGSSLAIWQANPAVYSSDQELSSSVVGLAYTYSNKLTAGSGSITLRETNSSGTTVQTWSTSQVTIDGNQFTADALSSDLKSNQLYHITIPAGFFTDPNGTNSVGVAYTFNTKEQIWNLFTWGRGSVPGSGGLGQNNQTDRSSPTQIPGNSWSAVSQGSNLGFFLASKNDSTLWSWGQNAWGQLGQSNTSYYSSPRQIGSDTTWAVGVEKIAKGTFLSLAIKTDGTLWTWGRNEFGQLGLNNTTNKNSPTQVPGTTWRSVWTSHYSSYATKTDGTLWSWGENTRGKLGQSNQTQYSSPRQIPGTTWNDGMGGDTAVGCTKTDGTMWVWGDDDDGTLGLGQRDQHKYSPFQLPGTTWSNLAGAYRCFWAAKTDGTLWSWGQNETEQLGLGIPDNNKRSSPTQIGSDTTWRYERKDLAGGQRGGFAIKTNNTMWAWGRGGYGVLGNNATNDHDSPIQVLGTKWRQVAKGRESAAGIQDTELS